MTCQKLTQDKVDHMIKEHKIWLESNYAKGKRADFSYTNLKKLDLSNADLRYADFRGADLRRTNLKNTDLRSSDFANVIVYRHDAKEANLNGAYCVGADFREAYFFRNMTGR